ncbi:hypothetical protein EAF00_009013 [Botryotinia globosa]|nr:hypothetical protein EAF00_009013 [Botryotinia globosa]
MSTSLTTGKTKQFTDSGQDNTKLLVLEQILKELRDVSYHLRKQETHLSSVENGYAKDPSWLMESLSTTANGGITKGNTIQVYSNDERKIQIVDKTDEISSGDSTAVPLKHGIRGAISLPLDVMQIYHTNGIAFDRLGRKGTVEDRVSRLATSSEMDRWKSVIIRYIIGAQESNTGSQNINCLDSAPTSCPVGTSNSRPLVCPWRRVISISCPELRSTNLAQELGRREGKDDKYQIFPALLEEPLLWITSSSRSSILKYTVDKDEYCKDFSNGMPRILLESSYRTLLELKPMTFNKTISSVMHSDGTPQNALSTFFDYTIIAVPRMIQKWEQILEYFENLITEKIAFLDPLKHDNLLVDDETFSRSKRYFWAISTLKELDANSPQLKEMRFLEGSRKHMRGRLGQLEEIAKRLRDKRQEALDLRDGLFNARDVMESRAATRLGENVKLLTFSVWSIKDEIFSLRSLETVATVVGLSTYLIVSNLDSLMNFSRALHRRFVIFAISMMKTEASDTTWGERATIFEKFSVQMEIEHKPSDWRLVQYLLYRALGTVGIIGKSTVLFKHIKQRLSLAKIASMKEARNPIWRGRAQRFEDAWAEKSTYKPSIWRMCQYILIKWTGFSLISACLYSSCGDQTVPQSSQSQTTSGDLENQQN